MEETVLTQAINIWDSRIEHYSKCRDLPPKFMDMLNEERLLLISLLPKEREQNETFGYNILSLTGCLNGNDDSFLNNLFNNNFTQYKPKEDEK